MQCELAQQAMKANGVTCDLTDDRRFESESVHTAGSCMDAEPFALLVVGESMTPEFEDGDVIIVEPGAPAKDGSFVLAQSDGQYIFRQLRGHEQGWWLCPLNDRFASVEIADLALIRGVVIQKSKPGCRSATRHYWA